MVRISDGRMSGTSYGACILHVAPESFVGGPLAFVENGDEIEVDVAARRIHLHVGEEDQPPPCGLEATGAHLRGYGADVLRPYRPGRRRLRLRSSPAGGQVPEPEIH